MSSTTKGTGVGKISVVIYGRYLSMIKSVHNNTTILTKIH